MDIFIPFRLSTISALVVFFLVFPSAPLDKMKQDLLTKISELGKELPLNTLDELIDKFGGPEKVSEVRLGAEIPSPYYRTSLQFNV